MPSEPSTHPGRRLVAVVGVAMASLVLAGCGAPSAKPGTGAAPFTDQPTLGSSPGPTPGLLEYPSQSLTIHYPPSLKSVRKQVVLAYAGFQVELQRAVHTGKVGAALDRRTVPAYRATLRQDIKALRKLTKTSSTTAITVNKVTVKHGTAALSLCTNISGTSVPAFVVMVRTKGGPFRTSAIGPDKSRSHC